MSNRSSTKTSYSEPKIMGVQIDKKSSKIIGDHDKARNALLDYLLFSQS